MTRSKPGVKRAVELLLLAAATLLFVHSVARLIGINAGEDSATMFQSPLLTRHSLPWYLHGPGEEWGPLYMAWFRLLALVCPQPYRLYFFDWQVVAAIVALLPPLLRVRCGWLYTLAALTLPVLVVGPYMALFAAIFPVLALSLLLRRQRSYSTALASGAVLCFVMEFVRPEYAYGLYLSVVGVCIAVLLEWRAGHAWRPLAGKVGLALLLAAGMRGVLSGGAVNRSGMSFEQHSNLRAQENGQLPPGESPWTSKYTQMQFGVDTTHTPLDTTAVLGDFVRANPRLFVSHLLDNLRDQRTWVVLLLFAAGTLWPWVLGRGRPLRPLSVMLMLVCAAPVAGIIVVYPRDHYPVPVTAVLVLLAVQAWDVYGPQRMTWPVAGVVGVVLLGFAEVGRMRLQAAPFPAQRSMQAGIECAITVDRMLPGGGAGVVYLPLPNVAGYLPHAARSAPLDQVQTWVQVQGWVRQNRPELVELDGWSAAQMQVTPTEADRFLLGEMGYVVHACPAAGDWKVYTAGR